MISHHHKCVFIHIPKNAGQSVENVFLNSLGLTWEQRAPLLLRSNDNPDLGPERLAHLKSHEYLQYKYMTAEQYEEYFTFAIVRNPWGRAVSFYNYLGYSDRCSFNNFLTKELINDLWRRMYWFVGPQSEYVYHHGEINVEFIGKFENLQNDFYEICKKLGLKATRLPHVNQSKEMGQDNGRRAKVVNQLCNFLQEPDLYRILQKMKASLQMKKVFPKYKHYWEYYDEESKQIVSSLYKDDIENFNYSFGNHQNEQS